MDENKSFQCSRIIRPSKFEKPSVKARNWWKELFRIMEEIIFVPPHQRCEIIRHIFPLEIFEKIVSFLNLEDTHKRRDIVRYNLNLSRRSSSDKLSSEKESLFDASIRKQATYRSPSLSTERLEKYNNPYLNFFRLHEDDAAIWRSIRQGVSRKAMGLLEEKAKAIAGLIALRFTKWLKNIEKEMSNSNRTLDVSTVKEVFEDAFYAHLDDEAIVVQAPSQKLIISDFVPDQQEGADEILELQAIPSEHHLSAAEIEQMFDLNFRKNSVSVAVSVKELPTATKQIAEAREVPKSSWVIALYRNVKSDLRQYQRKEKLVAFGKCLPDELKRKPLRENNAGKWMSFKCSREDLSTMEAVWRGITHLSSTINYYRWCGISDEFQAPYLKNHEHEMIEVEEE